jgi:hypothetical protein
MIPQQDHDVLIYISMKTQKDHPLITQQDYLYKKTPAIYSSVLMLRSKYEPTCLMKTGASRRIWQPIDTSFCIIHSLYLRISIWIWNARTNKIAMYRSQPNIVFYFYTVSWWIRKLSCIEEVPRFFFWIQFKIKFKNLNWLQLNLNWELLWGIWPVHF